MDNHVREGEHLCTLYAIVFVDINIIKSLPSRLFSNFRFAISLAFHEIKMPQNTIV